MPLFSKRSWKALIAHDRAVIKASQGYEQAARKFLASRQYVTLQSQLEFRIDFIDALTELRHAIGALRAFQSRHPLSQTE